MLWTLSKNPLYAATLHLLYALVYLASLHSKKGLLTLSTADLTGQGRKATFSGSWWQFHIALKCFTELTFYFISKLTETTQVVERF